jgi:hypothetical protein
MQRLVFAFQRHFGSESASTNRASENNGQRAKVARQEHGHLNSGEMQAVGLKSSRCDMGPIISPSVHPSTILPSFLHPTPLPSLDGPWFWAGLFLFGMRHRERPSEDPDSRSEHSLYPGPLPGPQLLRFSNAQLLTAPACLCLGAIPCPVLLKNWQCPYAVG